ncbi:hypothetical protein ACB098_06G149300 [Castanea mollissima]|uniref:Legume lectin domain-containing protein n=1 Tax=Castanea mollissima TaxID=60419 RepID=A0A8J4RTT2_9ROSI|nr:hypothetical protein CMV_007369 [Castanea mollissima]
MMAEIFNFRRTSFSLAVILFALTLISNSISALSFQTLTNNPNFDSKTALFGDAELADDGSYVKLTRPSISTSGMVMRADPFVFADPTTSFSSEFSFSISPGDGDGLVLALVPSGGSFVLSDAKRFLAVEFDTRMDVNVGDLNANHVGINVNDFESVSVSNVSALNLVLNSGERLKSWIDYEASSKRIEVRLGKFEDPRPNNPVLAYAIDLAKMWAAEEVRVGITSSNSNSTQSCSVYSWSFRVRKVRNSMHSMPVDPRNVGKERGENVRTEKRGFCLLRMIGQLIFATACAALVAFMVIFMWMIFGNVRSGGPVFTAKSAVYPGDFRYEKFDVVVVEKDGDDLKK